MAEASQTVQNIKALLKSLAKLDVNFRLVRTDVLGAELDFSDNRTLYEDIQSLAEKTADLPWENVTEDTAETVHALLRTLSDRVREITSFSPQALQGENVVQKRDEISSNTRDAIINLKRAIIPLVGFLVMMDDSPDSLSSKVEEITEQASRQIQQALEETSQARTNAQKSAADVEQILAGARTASVNLGGEKEADTFDKAAKRYDKAAFWWLLASVGSALVTIGSAFGLVLVWATDGDITNADVLQLVLVRLRCWPSLRMRLLRCPLSLQRPLQPLTATGEMHC